MPQARRGRLAPAEHAVLDVGLELARRGGEHRGRAGHVDAHAGGVAPQARNEAAVSPQPATTGVPAFSPQRRATPAATWPTTAVRVDDPRQLGRRHVERSGRAASHRARDCRQSR